MPSTTLIIKWPNAEVDEFYSPSTIINHYFKEGQEFSKADFEKASVEAFTHASKRVEQVHGFECTSAKASLATILSKLENLQNPEDRITVVEIQ